jgi:hypothetical protein
MAAATEPAVLVKRHRRAQVRLADDDVDEVLEAVTFYPDGSPDWTDAGICDHRGGGGAQGFAALVRALEAAEENAKSLGFDPPKRVPK